MAVMDASEVRLTVTSLRDNAANSERDWLRHTYSGIGKAVVSRANCQITRWVDKGEEKGERETYEAFSTELRGRNE